MQVAVAGVEHVRDTQPMPLARFLHQTEDLGKPRARDHPVLDVVVR